MNNTDKENELKMTGTCGHRISEGVASWVKQDGQLVYGTFCGDCVYFFHKQGRLVNKELSDLIINSENLSNDSLKAELEQLKHEYREKLGYLSSKKTVVQTPVSIELLRLEMRQLLNVKENENKYLKAELEKARELIRLQNDILCAVYTENSATVVIAKEFLKREGE